MGSYDTAVKVILSRCRHAALEFFLGLEAEESQVVELPQESTSVRTSDFPLWVRTRDGKVFIVLLEVQTRWEADVPLWLLEYDVRHRLKTGLPVLPVVMVLTPSGGISDTFEDGGIRYRWRVLSLAAMDARSVLDSKKPLSHALCGLDARGNGPSRPGGADSLRFPARASRQGGSAYRHGASFRAGFHRSSPKAFPKEEGHHA